MSASEIPPKSTQPASSLPPQSTPSLKIESTNVQIDKLRLEHLLNLEKEYKNIIAYGVKYAIESKHN